MADCARAGLRVRLKLPLDEHAKEKEKKRKLTENSKWYRLQHKYDPDYIALNKAKCQRYRDQQKKSLTPEELKLKTDSARLRKQKSRALKKQNAAQDDPSSLEATTPTHKNKKPLTRQTRQAQEGNREKWRNAKAKERANWSSQKKRRVREKASQHMREKRAKKSTPNTKATPSVRPHDVASPSPRRLKKAYTATLQESSFSRSKDSLARRRLLKSLVAEDGSSGTSLYHRKEESQTAKAFREFLHDSSVHAPGKKTVTVAGHQKKILTKRLKRLHKDFINKFPDKVSLRTFYRLKPKNILSSQKLIFNQCVCEVCANIDMKVDILNKYLPADMKIEGRDALSDLSLCDPQNWECIRRKCNICGVQKAKEICLQIENPQTVKWRKWALVDRERKGRRKELVQKEGSLRDLIDELMSELQPLSLHLSNFRWQYHQFKLIKTSLPSNWALAIFDYSENFASRYQNEAQGVYYNVPNITVHPCVLHYACGTCSEPVTEHKIFFSDDMIHDAHFVREVTKVVRAHLESEVPGLEKVVIFSDGCSAQYKSKVPFYHLAVDPPGVERCFFGSRHGKNECDAVGGVIKRLVEHDILTGLDDGQPCVIQSAEDLYIHCNNHHRKEMGCKHTEAQRSFNIIPEGSVERSLQEVHTLAGTRQLHSLKQIQPNTLAVRQRSCFCGPCIAESDSECINAIPWVIVDLDNQGKTLAQTKKADKKKPKNKKAAKKKPKICYKKKGTLGQKKASSQTQAKTYEATFRPAEGCSHDPIQPEDERASLYLDVLNEMKSCASYDDLRSCVLENADIIKALELPTTWPKTVADVTDSQIDPVALKLRPRFASELYPLTTTADGNCMPRAISTLVFDNEDGHHVEMRVRVVVELVLHTDDYVEGVGMGGPSEALKAAQMCCDSSLTPEDSPTSEELLTIFQNDVMDVRKQGAYMGLWQLAALANILSCKVRSVYPIKGPFSALANKVFLPRDETVKEICIMWTSLRQDMEEQNWIANHVVPLMHMVDPNNPVSVASEESLEKDEGGVKRYDIQLNDFFLVRWEKSEYIAQVQAIDTDVDLVYLSFMIKGKQGLYRWPLEEEFSWENVSTLRKKVYLTLNVEQSTQRVQYFSVIEM